MKHIIIGALALGAAGCASIVEGTDQDITIKSDPSHAVCEARQKGKLVGSTSLRSPVLNVGKSRKDLIITCFAEGYEPQTVRIESSTSGWGIAGAVTLDLGITDYMTGALNKYPEAISVVMMPAKGAPPPIAAATAVIARQPAPVLQLAPPPVAEEALAQTDPASEGVLAPATGTKPEI